MRRRRAWLVSLAIAAGALGMSVLTPGVAVGKQSPSEPKERIVVCHDGKDHEVKVQHLAKHLDHGDTIGSCPQG